MVIQLILFKLRIARSNLSGEGSGRAEAPPTGSRPTGIVSERHFHFPIFFKLSVVFVIQKTLSMETNNLANEDAMQAVETKSSENGKLSVLLVLTATIGQRLTNPVASA